MEKVGVEGFTRNRGGTRLIVLCYQVANPPKTKDKNNKGGGRYD